ncbi:hypothetical protein DW839_08500 [Enterocloster bolteae]|uniref:Uncharacterized protein n=1 Tax=Enterocloster bolteae TaxID=208479 RepID=A0A414AXH4_9FIRM|nr:hypothetical protein DW839_08500 [Enterocloster bolteae]
MLYLPLKASLNQINSLSGALLVLNTLRKMHKIEFCLNNHTTVLNTNFKEMLTVNTYTYSQPIEIPANYGKKISIALTIPDDYVFLCVTNIKTNEEVAYSYFTGIEQNVLTCFVGNDREVPKIIPNGISVDVLLIKKMAVNIVD